MHFASTLVTAPQASALTLAEAKSHLRLDNDETGAHEDDAYVQALIETAQAHLDGPDGILARTIMQCTWEDEFDCKGYAPWVELRQTPATTVVSVTVGGALLEDEWRLRHRDSGHAVLVFDEPQTGLILVQYQAGAATPAEVPAPLKHAMKLHIGSMYEQRETEVIGVTATCLPQYNALISPYKKRRIY